MSRIGQLIFTANEFWNAHDSKLILAFGQFVFSRKYLQVKKLCQLFVWPVRRYWYMGPLNKDKAFADFITNIVIMWPR